MFATMLFSSVLREQMICVNISVSLSDISIVILLTSSWGLLRPLCSCQLPTLTPTVRTFDGKSMEAPDSSSIVQSRGTEINEQMMSYYQVVDDSINFVLNLRSASYVVS
jgi:hypothetical protein